MVRGTWVLMKNGKIILSLLILVLILLTLYFTVFRENSNDVNVYDYYSGEQREDDSDKDMIYLWDEDNIPTETEYTENDNGYFDDPGFVPYLTVYDVPKATKIKGAMLISLGGAFIFRSEVQEGSSVATEFANRGYVSFVVHYRVNPYTEAESGIDIARAIKYVRYYADDYDISPDNIGVVGFSAGGIANGHAVLEFGGMKDGTLVDGNYKPDEIDKTSSTPNAVIMGYSFYGRLSVADLNESTFDNFDLPPTYYVYGTEDPFYTQFNAQVDLLQRLNKDIEVKVLDDYPHGFGAGGNWIDGVSTWLDDIFER